MMGYDIKNVSLTFTDRRVLRDLATAELRRRRRRRRRPPWRPALNPEAVRNALNKLYAADKEVM